MATLSATETRTQPVGLVRSQVALVGDPINRRRLEMVLENDQFEVVAAGSTIAAMLDSARDGFEVAVLIGGAELLARGGAVEKLRTMRPECSIVIVAQSEDRSLIRKALRAEADGFVNQSEAEQVLPVTLSAVIAGQLSVPDLVRDRVPWTVLSLRERQVLELVAAGFTNRQIARELYLSESTVKSHLSTSFRKLGVCSRAEAAAAVLDPDDGLGNYLPASSPLLTIEQQLLGTPA